MQIEVGNDLKIDFHLKIGSINETVEVKDEAPLTEASNAVLSGVLSNKAINELPLQGRDFQNLLPLHPGVQRDPGGGFHTLTSNGNRPDDNNFIIDGATDNDAYYGETVMNDAGISGTPASTLPLDAIQEFATTEQPGADYGVKTRRASSISASSPAPTKCTAPPTISIAMPRSTRAIISIRPRSRFRRCCCTSSAPRSAARSKRKSGSTS